MNMSSLIVTAYCIAVVVGAIMWLVTGDRPG